MIGETAAYYPSMHIKKWKVFFLNLQFIIYNKFIYRTLSWISS